MTDPEPEPPETAARPLLEVQGLEVVFDGFRAVDGLDFAVAEGELRFLIGPNGAGKTTLIDSITGLTRPAGGTIRFGDEPARRADRGDPTVDRHRDRGGHRPAQRHRGPVHPAGRAVRGVRLRLADRYVVLDAGEEVASGETATMEDGAVRRLLAV